MKFSLSKVPTCCGAPAKHRTISVTSCPETLERGMAHAKSSIDMSSTCWMTPHLGPLAKHDVQTLGVEGKEPHVNFHLHDGLQDEESQQVGPSKLETSPCKSPTINLFDIQNDSRMIATYPLDSRNGQIVLAQVFTNICRSTPPKTSEWIRWHFGKGDSSWYRCEISGASKTQNFTNQCPAW